MKTTMITLAAIFSLTLNVLVAANIAPIVNPMTSEFVSLAPATPAEASFEETTFVMVFLAPVAPLTAEFSDIPETIDNISYLAPLTPSEADFSSEEIHSTDTVNLEPVTPESADFSETI